MTNKAQHTPAPWRYNKVNDFVTACQQPKEPVICQVARIPEYEANAHLIAAAPDLLEALEDVTRILKAMTYMAGLGKGQQERLQKALAAIAKARG